MHSFLKIVGAIIAAGGVLVAAVAAYGEQRTNSGAALTGIAIGIGVALPGAMLYCFGAIVEHLRTLLEIERRQLRVLEQMAGVAPDRSIDTSRWSARDRAKLEAQAD